jgi:hypothetical protein
MHILLFTTAFFCDIIDMLCWENIPGALQSASFFCKKIKKLLKNAEKSGIMMKIVSYARIYIIKGDLFHAKHSGI